MENLEKDIKDYILSEDSMNELKEQSKRKKSKRRNTAEVVQYKVVLQDGCDFIIEKSKSRCKYKQQLVILVSQNQYYVQVGDGTRKLLTTKLLREYLKELQGWIILPKVTWLSEITNNPQVISCFMDMICSETAVKMMRKGYFYLYTSHFDANVFGDYKVDFERRRLQREPVNSFFHPALYTQFFNVVKNPKILLEESPYAAWVDPYDDDLNIYFQVKNHPAAILVRLYESAPALYTWMINYLAEQRGSTKKKLFEESLFTWDCRDFRTLQSFFSFALIEKVFGDYWAKEAVKEYYMSGIEDIIPCKYLFAFLFNKATDDNFLNRLWDPWEKLSCRMNFKAESFIHYLFSGAVRQGFADDLKSYITVWDTVLRIQQMLYGSIKEKYPKNLLLLQNKLSYTYRKYKSKRREEQWEQAALDMKKYEYANQQYEIIYPKKTRDLVNEANQQKNCVEQYEDRILEGREMIFFMRARENRNSSLVTIELFPDGNIGQIFLANNEYLKPESKEMKFIKEWAAAKKLCLPDEPVGARG